MKELHLSMKDNGSVINADTDTTISISLDANPTTAYEFGHEWILNSVDQTIVQSLQSNFVRSTGTALGAGGMYVFTVKAVKKGTTRLSFKYWRRREGDKSIIKRFEIQVNVI